jgi:hypothetical protein
MVNDADPLLQIGQKLPNRGPHVGAKLSGHEVPQAANVV